jgi:hypothetical protein
MKSILKTLVTGVACLSLSSAFGQLGLSTQVLGLTDTSYIGGVDAVTIRIKNLDTAAYSGYINISYSTDTVTFTPTTFCSISNVVLAGLDSVDQACTFTFDSTYYNPGGNIIVVWSSGSAKAAADSVWANIYLHTTAGLHEYASVGLFSVYPTLGGDYLFLESSTQVMPEKIFISDVSGRMVSVPALASDARNRVRINIGDLNGGIYFLNAILPDKSRFVAKFVKVE